MSIDVNKGVKAEKEVGGNKEEGRTRAGCLKFVKKTGRRQKPQHTSRRPNKNRVEEKWLLGKFGPCGRHRCSFEKHAGTNRRR